MLWVTERIKLNPWAKVWKQDNKGFLLFFIYSWSFSPLTNGPWHYRKSVFETPWRHWGFHFPKHWKFTPSPQISYHCWKNLAVPEDSWSLCPSDLWSVVSTMKVVSKGHLAKNRCREGSSTFVHMSLAGVHPREAKTTRIPSPSWSASLHPSGWDHLCLSGNYRALHLMYGNVQAKTWFRRRCAAPLIFISYNSLSSLASWNIWEAAKGMQQWKQQVGRERKKVKGNTSIFIKIRTIVSQSCDKNYFLFKKHNADFFFFTHFSSLFIKKKKDKSKILQLYSKPKLSWKQQSMWKELNLSPFSTETICLQTSERTMKLVVLP